MSKAVYDMAKKYYPDKWNKAMIDKLYKDGKLTKAEYENIIGEDKE